MFNDAKIELLGEATRHYRAIKTYLLKNKPPIITGVFFRAIAAADGILSGRKEGPQAAGAKALWKRTYHAHYSRHPEEILQIKTDHPVAFSSDDHKHPRGTLYDNSRNPRFNAAVYHLFGQQRRLKFMDLGCAGGGLVKSFLEDGHVAVGVEGSDISRRLRSGEWDTIPLHLFTSDITKPFSVTDANGEPVLFDLISAWEVLEHIPEELVPGLIDNIFNNLRPGGYFFCSIDLLPDGNPLTGAVYHRILKPGPWWEEHFAPGFEILKDHGFSSRDMVRGNGLSLKDWRPEHGGGIHLVLRKKQ